MSMVKQNSGSRPQSLLRFVAAGSVAALLLGSSFYAAQAGNNAGYSDSLNGGEIAAIGLGGAAGLMIVADIMKKDKDDSASAEKAKKADSGIVKQVRLVPSQKNLGAGDSATVDVQARYEGSQTWETVTNDANVKLLSGGLTKVDGAKNAFAVPYGSKVSSGKATIEASFGGQSATTSVAVN
jgi:hypothetical protein